MKELTNKDYVLNFSYHKFENTFGIVMSARYIVYYVHRVTRNIRQQTIISFEKCVFITLLYNR